MVVLACQDQMHSGARPLQEHSHQDLARCRCRFPAGCLLLKQHQQQQHLQHQMLEALAGSRLSFPWVLQAWHHHLAGCPLAPWHQHQHQHQDHHHHQTQVHQQQQHRQQQAMATGGRAAQVVLWPQPLGSRVEHH